MSTSNPELRPGLKPFEIALGFLSFFTGISRLSTLIRKIRDRASELGPVLTVAISEKRVLEAEGENKVALKDFDDFLTELTKNDLLLRNFTRSELHNALSALVRDWKKLKAPADPLTASNWVAYRKDLEQIKQHAESVVRYADDAVLSLLSTRTWLVDALVIITLIVIAIKGGGWMKETTNTLMAQGGSIVDIQSKQEEHTQSLDSINGAVNQIKLEIPKLRRRQQLIEIGEAAFADLSGSYLADLREGRVAATPAAELVDDLLQHDSFLDRSYKLIPTSLTPGTTPPSPYSGSLQAYKEFFLPVLEGTAQSASLPHQNATLQAQIIYIRSDRGTSQSFSLAHWVSSYYRSRFGLLFSKTESASPIDYVPLLCFGKNSRSDMPRLLQKLENSKPENYAVDIVEFSAMRSPLTSKLLRDDITAGLTADRLSGFETQPALIVVFKDVASPTLGLILEKIRDSTSRIIVFVTLDDTSMAALGNELPTAGSGIYVIEAEPYDQKYRASKFVEIAALRACQDGDYQNREVILKCTIDDWIGLQEYIGALLMHNPSDSWFFEGNWHLAQEYAKAAAEQFVLRGRKSPTNLKEGVNEGGEIREKAIKQVVSSFSSESSAEMNDLLGAQIDANVLNEIVLTVFDEVSRNHRMSEGDLVSLVSQEIDRLLQGKLPAAEETITAQKVSILISGCPLFDVRVDGSKGRELILNSWG